MERPASLHSKNWDRIVGEQIAPGRSLEDYDIFENARGVPTLIPRRRFTTDIDKEQRKEGREYLHTCTGADIETVRKELESLRINDIVSFPADHDWNGQPFPPEQKDYIVLYGKLPIVDGVEQRVLYHELPIPESV